MTDAPTVRRTRWWERSAGYSIEAEESWFEEEGLGFRLDEDLVEKSGVVVFRGDLRLDGKRSPATVVYPPSYGVGGHPSVVAPELDLGRHRSAQGVLCLDHEVFGRTRPMYGAEAAARAERLWWLWEHDREQLEREEADAPDPRANYYEYEPESAITLIDVDVSGASAGYFRLGVLHAAPFRAALTELRVTHPEPATAELGPNVESLAGMAEVNGAWLRVGEPPPVESEALRDWVRSEHGTFIKKQLRFARGSSRGDALPAVVGFVYPDEGPNRGETHDAWLFLVIRPDGQGRPALAVHLRSVERWLRQPHLEPLKDKRVAVVGVGAIGSQVADLLAKAGVGYLFLVDHDIITAGNRVRHQLDLIDVGRSKVGALAQRLQHVNPWAQIDVQGARAGGALLGPHEPQGQALDDKLAEVMGTCDLLINASAHGVTGSHLSQIGNEVAAPILHAWVSAGAWGGRILRQRPGRSGCWDCLGLTQQRSDEVPEGTEAAPEVSDDPQVQEVMERGCADPTFTGPGFELSEISSATARLAVQTLLEGEGGYPPADYDLATLKFRDEHAALPGTVYTRLAVHPDCTLCDGLRRTSP